MRLAAVARRFDTTVCADAYSGVELFKAQLALYDDTRRDNEVGERRVLSTAASSVIPARRVVSAAGLKWIIGKGNPDTYNNEVLRVGYVAHEATFLSQVRTLGQLCRNEVGFKAWSARAWIKNLADNEQSSDLIAQQNLHYSLTEPVKVMSICTHGTQLFIVRTVHTGPAGTLICLADEMPEPVIETASALNGTWNPVTETTSGGTVNFRVLRVRWQSLYEYGDGSSPKFGDTDIQVVIAKSSLTALPGLRLTLSDGVWQVASVISENDVWVCRAVKHG